MRVLQVVRHGIRQTFFLNILQSLIDSHYCRVILGCLGNINHRLGQGNPGLWEPQFFYCLRHGLCQYKCVGVGIAHIFCRCDQQSPDNKTRVFPTCDHFCQPVNGRIGIRTAQTFLERRGMVVMLSSLFIVKRGGLLNDALNDFQTNLFFFSQHNHIMRRLQHIESTAGIAIGMTDNQIHRFPSNLQGRFPQPLL